MALFIAEGDHAVGIGNVFRLRQRFERHAQHACGIAQIEQMVLRQFQHRHVARMICSDAVAYGKQLWHIIRNPCGGGINHQRLAGSDHVAARVRTGKIGGGVLRCHRRFHEHPQHRRIGVDQRAVGVCVRCCDDPCRFGVIAEKSVDEVIDAVEGLGIFHGDG